MTTMHRILDSLGADARTPTGLLRALAAAEGDFSTVCAALRAAGLDEARTTTLAAGVPRALSILLPTPPPDDPDDREAWLRQLDLADRAGRSLRALAGPRPPWAEPLLAALAAATEAGRRALLGVDWAWSVARMAGARGPGLLSEALPPGLPARPIPALWAAWETDGLHPEDDAELRRRVAEPGPWQAAWRHHLARRLTRLDLLRPPPPFDQVAPWPLQALALPHLGAGARLEVHSLPGGPRWRWPGQPPWQTRWEQARVDLPGDSVTGPLCATPLVHDLAPLPAAERAVDLLEGLDPDHPEAEALAIGAAGALGSPTWEGELRALAQGFSCGEVTGEPAWAALAVRLRLALDTLAAALLSPALFDRLDALDAALRPVRDAVLTIDDDDWGSIAATEVFDPEAWWGWRARVEGAVGEFGLTDALLALARSQEGLFARFQERMARDPRAAGGRLLQAWAAACTQPAAPRVAFADPHVPAGEARVPVLVVLDGHDQGLVLELRIGWGPEGGDPWTGADLLRHGARRAVRTAFWAAAALTGDGLPAHDLDRHRISLHPRDAAIAVDGDSLALSAALAFASLWTGIPLPLEMAASARLGPDGAAVGVGSLPEKLQALAGVADEALPVRLLVAREQPVEEVPPHVSLERVTDLREALEIAGLRQGLQALRPAEAGPGRDTCERALHEMMYDAQRQRLEPYRRGGDADDAWLNLADRMRRLVTAMERRGFLGEPASLEARSWLALAYSYGREQRLVEVLGPGFDPGRVAEGAPRTFARIVELCDCILREDWAGGAARIAGIEDSLRHLDPHNLLALRGFALGTLGRFWLHNRSAAQGKLALELLEEAVEHHRAHVPRETPRSRTYLANALVRAGRAAEALAQTDLALEELERVLAGCAYGATTGMFVRYERARALLALGQPADAAREARISIAAGAQLAWQIPGPLRTLAWACARLGDEDGRRAAIEALRSLVGGRGGVGRRILQEAEAGPVEGGEVE